MYVAVLVGMKSFSRHLTISVHLTRGVQRVVCSHPTLLSNARYAERPPISICRVSLQGRFESP
jgi:hypothetical protein